MMKKSIFTLLGSLLLFSCSGDQTYYINDYILATDGGNTSPAVARMIEDIAKRANDDHPITIHFADTTYNFHPEGASTQEYYISNHDQDNPKKIGINIQEIDNVTIKGGGAKLLFHGRMLPIVISKCDDTHIENLSIDFKTPHIGQCEILENKDGYITYKMADFSQHKIVDGTLVLCGEGWEHTPTWGIAFENETKRVVYQTSDIGLGVRDLEVIADGVYKAPWNDARLIEGTVIAMRSYKRPTPGIFLDKNDDTTIKDVTIHYAEGMGLLAQLCDDITLDGFNIALSEGRYFTTQADATHFSGCKGEIISINGLYENMMDDAINVHGTYLKIIKKISDKKVIGKYMHSQSYGFEWGYPDDEVQFISSNTMELVGGKTTIKSIKPVDKDVALGATEFEIEFTDEIDSAINADEPFGIENLEWTASVEFSGNIIRNNRARGTLFSTPKSVVVENNLFDYTSGTAILLCGDCNGWYETGACRDVVIRNNKFIGSLTSQFQFTNAIISIYPEIPNLKEQQKYFHGGEGSKGIIIENNYFETFDMPIVYAKSTDGLVFKGNTIKQIDSYKPFHWNNKRFFFERVINYTIEDNDFSTGFDTESDVLIK